MSVMIIKKGELQQIFDHFSFITCKENDEIAIKIIKLIDENYKDEIKFYQKYRNKTLIDSRLNCLFCMLANFTKINNIEYMLKYEDEDFFNEEFELEELKKNNGLGEKTKSLYITKNILGSMLYNIGENVRMNKKHQETLEKLYKIYSENKEVKNKQYEIDLEYSKHF